MGIAPLPIQRPIPIWIGGQADAALRRVAALGEGWLPMIGPQEAQRDGHISRLHRYAQQQGRDPASIGLDPILTLTHGGPVPEGAVELLLTTAPLPWQHRPIGRWGRSPSPTVVAASLR